MDDIILNYLDSNYNGLNTVDLNDILKPIEKKYSWNYTKKILTDLDTRGLIEYRDVNKYEHDNRGSLNCLETNWGAIIRQEGRNYLEQKRREIRQDEIISKQSKISNRANFWSPFFAALAALSAILTFVLQLQDKPLSGKIELLQKQTIKLDSAQRIHQTQIDSFARANKESENYPDSYKK